jgi:hypothetical protein
VTSVETEVGSDSTITVNQCHVGKEVKVGANVPKDKTIEIVKPQKSAVDALMESDYTSVVKLRESDSTSVDMPKELNYTSVNALGESDNPSVDSLRKLYNAELDLDREPDGIVVEHGELDSITIDAVGELNNAILDALMESDNATVHVLRDLDNAIDVLQESIAMDMLDTTEVDPTTSEYDMIDLDILEAKSTVEMEVREGELIEAANALYTMS